MKREEVKGILPDITDEQLTKIMDLHGADIERQKQTITTLTTERDAAKNQLDEANKKLEGYDPDWKNKAAEAESKDGQAGRKRPASILSAMMDQGRNCGPVQSFKNAEDFEAEWKRITGVNHGN